MEQLTKYSKSFEEFMDKISHPLKPYIPIIARFLLVVTFIEDTLRIGTQWNDQCHYLEYYRGMSYFFARLFLLTNMAMMSVGSVLAIARKYTTIAVAMLASVVVIQSIGYGLFIEMNFVFRNLSVIGGLLMLLSESMVRDKRRDLFAGLPQLSETEKSTYLLLAGRVLLLALFLSFLFGGEVDDDGFSLVRLGMIGFAFVACVAVLVGFQAKYSALILVVMLSIGNVLLNNWWSLHHSHPGRDFRKYDFFQVLSIMGGFLLLFSIGPGGLSIDEKKKSF